MVYHLEADEADRETIERVHDVHSDHCPVARSIRDSIDVTTEFVLE